MIQLLNISKKILIFFAFILSSCDNDNNGNSCTGSNVKDNCGVCREVNDPNWDSCYDACGVQNGQNDCSLYGICMGECECAGCDDIGNHEYNPDRIFTNNCACDNESLLSSYEVDNLYGNTTIQFNFIASGVQYSNELIIINNNEFLIKIDCANLGITDYIIPSNSLFTINNNINNNIFVTEAPNLYNIEIKDNTDTIIGSIIINSSLYPQSYFANILSSCNICDCSETDLFECDE